MEIIDAKFRKDELNILKGLKGKVFESYQHGAFFRISNFSYGKIRLVFQDKAVEITNYLVPIFYDNENDDIAMFRCMEVAKNSPYDSGIDEEMLETIVEETVKNVTVNEDIISIYDPKTGEQWFSFEYHNAVIIETDKNIYTFYNFSKYNETVCYSHNEEFENVFSLKNQKHNWSNPGINKVVVKRNKILL